ncbi:MAG: alkaline phosphatase family protein [Ignavibacteria bacterium]
MVTSTREEFEVVMGSFSPEMMPVTSALARNFAVYDNWFCAVPSQTFCNRSSSMHQHHRGSSPMTAVRRLS